MVERERALRINNYRNSAHLEVTLMQFNPTTDGVEV